MSINGYDFSRIVEPLLDQKIYYTDSTELDYSCIEEKVTAINSSTDGGFKIEWFSDDSAAYGTICCRSLFDLVETDYIDLNSESELKEKVLNNFKINEEIFKTMNIYKDLFKFRPTYKVELIDYLLETKNNNFLRNLAKLIEDILESDSDYQSTSLGKKICDASERKSYERTNNSKFRKRTKFSIF